MLINELLSNQIDFMLASTREQGLSVRNQTALFKSALMGNTDVAITSISKLYRDMTDSYFGYDAQVEKLSGGAPSSMAIPLLNAISDVYGKLSRIQKDAVLNQTLEILDKYDFWIVNGPMGSGHTSTIRNPQYLAEICMLSNNMYWPGLDEGRIIITMHGGSWQAIKEDLITKYGFFDRSEAKDAEGHPIGRPKIYSDFLVAYAFLRKDISNFGEEFASAINKNFLDQVITAIVKLELHNAKTPKEIAKRLSALEDLLPESLHAKLESAAYTEGWVDAYNFATDKFLYYSKMRL